MSDSPLSEVLQKNRRLAGECVARDADYFSRHAGGQSPKMLWIGCSDSRVAPEKIIGAELGEVFTHRNIANVAPPGDISCQSVIQYAVEMLRVQHIIVCGHYGCGGINAALQDKPLGRIDEWLRHIKAVAAAQSDALAGVSDDKRADKLCELNVLQQLQNVADGAAVQAAWRNGAPLTLHGWVYSIKDGLLKELQVIHPPAAGGE